MKFIIGLLFLLTANLQIDPQSGYEIVGITWSPDGTKYAIAAGVAGCGGEIPVQIIDAETNQTVQELIGHQCRAIDIAWSPDGSKIASSGANGETIVWNVSSGEIVSRFAIVTQIGNSVEWHPNSSKIVSVINGVKRAYVWDAASGEVLFTTGDHDDFVMYATWSPNGDFLATSTLNGEIRIWDSQTHAETKIFEYHSGVISIDWHPNGELIAGANEDGTITIWNIPTEQLISTLSVDTVSIEAVAWNSTGDQVASGNAVGMVRVWDTTDNQVVSTIDTQTGYIFDIAWRPGTNQVAYVGGYSGALTGLPSIVDVPVQNQSPTADAGDDQTITLPEAVGVIAWSPDGSMIAVASTEHQCDMDNPVPISTYIISVSSGMIMNTLTDHSCAIRDLAWSPESTKLAVGSADSVGVRVWDVQSGQLLAQNQRGLQAGVLALSWSPDGTQIGYTNMASVGVFMNAMSGETLDVFGGATTFDWSPDGSEIVSASAYDGIAYLSNTATPNVTQLRIEGFSITGGIIWSPDGSKIAATVSEDLAQYAVMIWDDTFTPLFEISGHSAPMIRKVWSPDGSKLWTGGRDNAIRVWDATTGQMVGEYQHSGVLGDFDLSPDGQQIVFTDPTSQTIDILEFPIANAGIDQSISDSDHSGSELVTLDGSGSSDPDGTIESYSWTENGVEIATGVNPQVDLAVGRHVITLTVTDDDGATSVDTVGVRVRRSG